MQNITVMVTGATGLIGQALIKKLLKTPNVLCIAFVRDKARAIKMFGNENPGFKYWVGDITSVVPVAMDIDYIIHSAGSTSSADFVAKPVETIMTTFQGTKNILDIAKINKVKGLIYLSTMEVYGSPTSDIKIDELHNSNLNTMQVRTCYPESKRLCENLCVSYASEYGVPVKIIRLTQTFGPGVRYHDRRVFAEFARCVIENRNIILKTNGETKRSYLYTEDAVDAILKVLINGKACEAYNAANEETYCSIYEMACMVAEKISGGKIGVIIDNQKCDASLGYAPTLHMNLDTRKLRALGWSPVYGLEDMFRKMIHSMKEEASYHL